MSETHEIYPRATRELVERRTQLAPGPADAFRSFSQSVFADGALPAKTKQLIAVAVAHVTQCPYCIRGHSQAAVQQGASPEEIMEAIWVAAEMRAGAAYAHSLLALDATTQRRPSRVLLVAAGVTAAVALYHWVVYMFGSEMLLALGAALLARENARKG